jgi:hypothetical protein
MEWHPAINVLFAGAADGNITFWRVNSGECKVLASVGISTEVGKIMPDGEPKIYLKEGLKFTYFLTKAPEQWLGMKMAVCESLTCAPAKASFTPHLMMTQSRAWIATGTIHWCWQAVLLVRQRSSTLGMERFDKVEKTTNIYSKTQIFFRFLGSCSVLIPTLRVSSQSSFAPWKDNLT